VCVVLCSFNGVHLSGTQLRVESLVTHSGVCKQHLMIQIILDNT